MALAVTLLRYTPAGTPDTAEVKVTASGNYATGGDALNLSPSNYADTNKLGIIGQDTDPPVTPPSVQAEDNLGGYYGQLVPGATLSAAKLKFFSPGGAEVAAGAYPAAITGGTVTVRVPLR